MTPWECVLVGFSAMNVTLLLINSWNARANAREEADNARIRKRRSV